MTSYLKRLLKYATVHNVSVCTWVWDQSSSCCALPISTIFGHTNLLEVLCVPQLPLYVHSFSLWPTPCSSLPATNYISCLATYFASSLQVSVSYKPPYMWQFQWVILPLPLSYLVLLALWYLDTPQELLQWSVSKELRLASLSLFISHVPDQYMKILSMETINNCLHHYYLIIS
jgi:hypothetical protein